MFEALASSQCLVGQAQPRGLCSLRVSQPFPEPLLLLFGPVLKLKFIFYPTLSLSGKPDPFSHRSWVSVLTGVCLTKIVWFLLGWSTGSLCTFQASPK